MMNNPMTELLNSAIFKFKEDFLNCKSLFESDTNKNHLTSPGEFGRYRENICKEFIQQFLPNYMKISDGFIINKDGAYSKQTDLVIYDYDNTPKLEKSGARFFPTETTYAIGEIKSILTRKELNEAIEGIRNTKKIRNSVPVNIRPVRPSDLIYKIDYVLENWKSIPYLTSDCPELFKLSEEIENIKSQIIKLKDENELKKLEELMYEKQRTLEKAIIYNLKVFEEMNLVSFIICEKISGIYVNNKIKDPLHTILTKTLISDEPFNFNVILSLEDGVFFIGE